MDQRSTMPERRRDAAPSLPMRAGDSGPACARAAMQLVGERKLVLDLAAFAAPADWHDALAVLVAGHQIALEPAVAAPRAGGLRHVARWAAGAGQAPAPAPPVFAPWQAFAPADLQNPLARAALPQAQWLASYLFDPAAPRSGASGSLDVMLASPHPAACLDDEDCHTALPRKAVLDAMIAAIREQGRERIAIIVPARARSAMAQRLLGAERALTRGDIVLDIIAVEDAIGRLIRSAQSWDAIIVLPEWRAIIAAVLAEISGVEGPCPLVWHDRAVVRITSEVSRDTAAVLPLDAATLMQGLALAAHHGGMGFAAQQLAHSWTQLRDSGVATAARRSLSPYGKQLDDAAFIALAASQPHRGGRMVPGWKALDASCANAKGNQPARSPVALTLVNS
jgi:hypothetical protein